VAVFLICYDLRKPDYDYDPVWAELDNIGAQHIQDSVWAVQSNKSANELFQLLWPHFHNEKDRLLISSINSYWGIHSMEGIPPLS
jgi:hypothetical protein